MMSPELPPNLERRDPVTRRLVKVLCRGKLSEGREFEDLFFALDDDNAARLMKARERDDLIPGVRALRVVRKLMPTLTQSEFTIYVWRFRIASRGNPSKLRGFKASAFDVARVYACLPLLRMLDPCAELVLVMDGLLWGTMPIPACQKRFEWLYAALRHPNRDIAKAVLELSNGMSDDAPEPTAPEVAETVERQLPLFK